VDSAPRNLRQVPEEKVPQCVLVDTTGRPDRKTKVAAEETQTSETAGTDLAAVAVTLVAAVAALDATSALVAAVRVTSIRSLGLREVTHLLHR
jgi:hypothetical protein